MHPCYHMHVFKHEATSHSNIRRDTYTGLIFSDGEKPSIEAVSNKYSLKWLFLLFLISSAFTANISTARATLFRCSTCHV